MGFRSTKESPKYTYRKSPGIIPITVAIKKSFTFTLVSAKEKFNPLDGIIGRNRSNNTVLNPCFSTFLSYFFKS